MDASCATDYNQKISVCALAVAGISLIISDMSRILLTMY